MIIDRSVRVMDTVYEIIGWLSIPVTLLSVIFMVVTWHRQRSLTLASLWIPILVSSASLWLYVRLIGVETRPVLSWLPFVGGLALGLYLGHASRVEAQGEAVVATRNPWSFVVWGASFVATQLVALLAPASAETMLGLLFAATGLTIGEQLALISGRSRQLGQMRSAIAATAAVVLVAAFGAALVPRHADAADVSLDLGEVAEFETEDGTVYAGRPDTSVDVHGVDGTYSGSSIDVTITNDTPDTLKVRVPVGTRLYPDNDGVQTMLTAGNEVIEVPPGKTVTKRIQAFCGEASDGAPGSGDNFTVGEVVTDPDLLRSLQEISRQFNNSSPDTPFDPYTAQHDGVWTHTDPESHAPPIEGEPGYDLFNPTPPGPSTEETGKSGGAVGGVTGGTAVLATKPSRGGKKGPKKTSKEPKPDADADADADADDDDGTAPWDKEQPDTKPDSGPDKQPEKQTTEPTDEQLYTKPTKKVEQPDKTPDKKPEKKPEKPTFTVGPVGTTPGTGKYTLDTGGGNVSYDQVNNSVSYEDSGLKASYDLDNNEGNLTTKDGRLTVNTHEGGGTAVVKKRNGTDTYTASKEGGTKSLTLQQDRTDGGHNRSYSLTSDSTGLTANRTSGNLSDTFHAGDDYWFEHSQPGTAWGVGFGDSGPKLSYSREQQLQMFGEKFKLTNGLSYADDQFHYTYDLEKKFDVNLFNKINVPLQVNVSGVTGPGSSQRITVGPAWRF